MFKVHKYYDSQEFDCCPPNIDHIKSFGEYALPNVKCDLLSTDKRFQMLEYDYVDGSHKPDKDEHITTIFTILGKIHSLNLVHSDIRTEKTVYFVVMERHTS